MSIQTSLKPGFRNGYWITSAFHSCRYAVTKACFIRNCTDRLDCIRLNRLIVHNSNNLSEIVELFFVGRQRSRTFDGSWTYKIIFYRKISNLSFVVQEKSALKPLILLHLQKYTSSYKPISLGSCKLSVPLCETWILRSKNTWSYTSSPLIRAVVFKNSIDKRLLI
jgi:hypothetical protein